MSAVKTAGTQPGEPAGRPYPAWTVVADHVGHRQLAVAQDRQAEKEARIWREFAAETRNDEERRLHDDVPKRGTDAL